MKAAGQWALHHRSCACVLALTPPFAGRQSAHLNGPSSSPWKAQPLAYMRSQDDGKAKAAAEAARAFGATHLHKGGRLCYWRSLMAGIAGVLDYT